jgi:hypothetical protein
MLILRQSPNDQFTMSLFVKLTNQIKIPHNSFYLWSAGLHRWNNYDEQEIRQQLFNNITEKYVVIGMKDHLTSGIFNPWYDTKPDVADYLDDMFKFYKDKKFILFTPLENLDAYLDNKNLIIIPWGGDITNQRLTYKLINPMIMKNFASKYTFISLNRNPRPARFYSLSLIFGLGLEKHGLISCMFQEQALSSDQHFGWKFTNDQQSIKNTINVGMEKLANATLPLTDRSNIYEKTGQNNNAINFSSVLSKYYKEVFIEIINETSYVEKCFVTSEKTTNSILGCCFPIWLSSQGTVKFYREMGMDVFDDIIDHSYDSIENPIDRMNAAITNNTALLTDPKLVKELWKKNMQRFLKNVYFIKNTIFDFYQNRAVNKFNEVLINEKLH